MSLPGLRRTLLLPLLVAIFLSACARGVEPLASTPLAPPTARAAEKAPLAVTSEARGVGAASVLQSGREPAGPTPEEPANASDATPPAGPHGRRGGVLRVAQPGDPQSCDLAMSRGRGYKSVHPCNPMLSQLVRISPTDHGIVKPDLALKWEVDGSGTEWTFALRDNAYWHNGRQVTADDVKFSLDRIIEPPDSLAIGRAGPIARYVSSVSQVRALDERTVSIRTDRPAASFLYNLASVYVSIYPRAETTALDPPSMASFSDVIGSGPFKYDSAMRGSAYKMTRFDRYYEPGLPYLDGVWYLVIPSPAVRLAALKSHEADILMLMTEPEAADLEANFQDRIAVLREPNAGGNTVQMNMRTPPFDDQRVRRAVNLAIDRDAARLALGGGFDGAIMPPGAWGLDPARVAALPGYGDKTAERRQARALLAEAGHPDGLDVDILVRSDPFSTTIGAFVVEQLKSVGIRPRLVPLEPVAYQDRLARREFAMIAHSHSFALDDPDNILPDHYSCGGSENFPGLCDAGIDDLIEAQSNALDPVERKALVDRVQELIWNQDAKVWFNWSVRRTAVWRTVRNYVQGGPSLYQGRRMEAVWLEDAGA